MKLRFRYNSLRLRVNQREVQDLAAGTPLAECISFPGNSSLSYILESSKMPEASASFQHGRIHVSAPDRDVKNWAEGDAVGMYFSLPVNGTQLKIAIEKDLECVDGPPDERDSDAFPRPAKSC